MSTVMFDGRADYQTIADWIKPDTSVLDLGCGDGMLLRHLRHTRRVRGYGIEINDANVLACVRNDVNIIQGNLERGLSGFDAGSFDYVILSQTLQAMKNTENILLEMLRVGREAVVTFPNFGYWRARWQLVFGGHMPVSPELPYEWYDTPNVHLCTLRDFEDFCADHAIRIVQRRVLTDNRTVRYLPNLRGSLAVYRCTAS
ncbi:MAG TPA: methionine biosynthesis protein MetW [Burkholderiales bacterium]|nr:methionine biosynthesis protein MetW [Burkholderiales bacterium]